MLPGWLLRYWSLARVMRCAHTAMLDEVLLKTPHLPVQQEVGLVDQADNNVCHNLGGTRFAEFAKIFERDARLTTQTFERIVLLWNPSAKV